MKKLVGKVFAAIIVMGFLLEILSPVFRLKYDNVRVALNVPAMEKLDVAFLGGSHAEGAFAPEYLEQKYNLKSYNFATGGQPIYLSYYYFKEILTRYNIDILVLDLYYLGLEDKYFFNESYVRRVVDNVPWSLNKIEMIENCTSEDKLTYYFDIIKYHSRWSELEKSDFSRPVTSAESINRGWGAGTNKVGVNMEEIDKTNDIGYIPERSKEYLEKILDLAYENDIQVIFTSLPHEYNADMAPGWVENEYELFNAVKIYAEKKKIPFIEFNKLFEEINFDFPNDMNNLTHVNQSGAMKVTDYLGNYINKYYMNVN